VVAVHALSASVPHDGETSNPLVYHNRTWHQLGTDSRIEA
jgi:hypothetical protein